MLFNVMKAYAVCDPEVGYCQGSAFLAGMLLLHMPEEDAFSVFMKLMSKGSGKIDFLRSRADRTHEIAQIDPQGQVPGSRSKLKAKTEIRP